MHTWQGERRRAATPQMDGPAPGFGARAGGSRPAGGSRLGIAGVALYDGPYEVNEATGASAAEPERPGGAHEAAAASAPSGAAPGHAEGAEAPGHEASTGREGEETAAPGAGGATHGQETEHAEPAQQDAPAARYIVPFDRAPRSSPDERVIFRAEFTDPHPAHYRIEFSTTGGHFDSQTGATTKTIAGLTSGNTDFFIPTGWNGTDTMRVVMRLKKVSDGSTVQTETWNFRARGTAPTTMTQQENDSERNLPGVYSYLMGPALATGSRPFYRHQSILEWFEGHTISNIAPADIQEAYRNTHGLTSADAITNHFIGAYSGNNGTFTVDSADKVYDQHGGHANVTNLVSRLVTPKEIHIDLRQIYEATPGTALGRYMVRRIRKTDGSWKVRKWAR
jgi:hypothetical protein